MPNEFPGHVDIVTNKKVKNKFENFETKFML